MTQTWFTSDTHFNDANVSNLRGFGSTEDHDAWVVKNWNRRVQPTDIVYHLGDVALGHPSKWIHLIAQLNGEVRLIAGNHDRVNPDFKNVDQNLFAFYLAGFSTIAQHAAVKYQGHKFLLSHYPYEGEGTQRNLEDRHIQWRLRDYGNILVHGHTHALEALSYSSQGTCMVHVGWDTWQRPVTAHEVLEITQQTK